MNPELQRNLWLEFTPQRIALMGGGLALAFFAAALPGGLEYGPSSIAIVLFYLIIVFYGTRAAALAVIGEIRDRTWDSQRLSALSPGAMMWGKLLGSTAYAWFGGLICLAVMLAGLAVHRGLAVAGLEAIYYLALGAIAQASAFLASLIAIHRRQSVSRLNAFVCQLVGIAAAVVVVWVWSIADPVSALVGIPHVDVLLWWGRSLDATWFLLASLALFAAWIVLACYRQMRIELQMKNGPLVWLGFLIFIGAYVAGFDAWLPKTGFAQALDATGARLTLAFATFAILTYLMVLLEPKDRVHYRWLLSRLRAGRIAEWLDGFQAWMTSYAAALLFGFALAIWVSRMTPDGGVDEALSIATLGFLTRDVSIFVLAQMLAGHRRADLGAVTVLVAIYLLIPAILGGLKLSSLWFVFLPKPTDPVWLGPIVAWVEGIVLAVLAFARVSLGEDVNRTLAVASSVKS
jgi:hypothetical protein